LTDPPICALPVDPYATTTTGICGGHGVVTHTNTTVINETQVFEESVIFKCASIEMDGVHYKRDTTRSVSLIVHSYTSTNGTLVHVIQGIPYLHGVAQNVDKIKCVTEQDKFIPWRWRLLDYVVHERDKWSWFLKK
jgi:hypothetical protein